MSSKLIITAVAALLALAVSPVWSAQPEDPRFQAPCCAPSGPSASAPGRWSFENHRDDMTGETSCQAVSPVSDVWVSEMKTDVPVRLVITVGHKRVLVSARIDSTGSPLLHNQVGGMGVKTEPGGFHALSYKVGQKEIAALDSGALVDAVLLSKSLRVRLRFWPYDTLHDTRPITSAGMLDAVQKAVKCGGGI